MLEEIPINKIICGDALLELKKLSENSVDSIVTDPPYGIGFMGKSWDTFKPDYIQKKYKERKKLIYKYDIKNGRRIYRKKPEWVRREARSDYAGQYDFSYKGLIGFQNWFYKIAKEMFRVLKPGGYLLSFGGTRTYHRMTCAIEDTGFEIRDCILWIYGSGFPKSLNISKAIDKMKGAKREKTGEDQKFGRCDSGIYQMNVNNPPKMKFDRFDKPTTPEAKQWEGWGTALKPAVEPIVVARKPLSEKTVASNVLKWGTGGINIDESRIGTEIIEQRLARRIDGKSGIGAKGVNIPQKQTGEITHTQGRFPANLILECICDEVKIEPTETKEPEEVKGGIWQKSQGKPAGRTYKGGKQIHTNPECPCYILDRQSGEKTGSHGGESCGYDWIKGGNVGKFIPKSQGGASRFFYVAKASREERNRGLEGLEPKQRDESRKEGNPGGDNPRNRGIKKVFNFHPTIKPIKLMEYLVRLVTPSKGIVLDPFIGSGTTAIACKKLGFNYIGIEKEKEYCEIAEARIRATPTPLL